MVIIINYLQIIKKIFDVELNQFEYFVTHVLIFFKNFKLFCG